VTDFIRRDAIPGLSTPRSSSHELSPEAATSQIGVTNPEALKITTIAPGPVGGAHPIRPGHGSYRVSANNSVHPTRPGDTRG
jgi:hypothetical protein